VRSRRIDAWIFIRSIVSRVVARTSSRDRDESKGRARAIHRAASIHPRAWIGVGGGCLRSHDSWVGVDLLERGDADVVGKRGGAFVRSFVRACVDRHAKYPWDRVIVCVIV